MILLDSFNYYFNNLLIIVAVKTLNFDIQKKKKMHKLLFF